MCRSLLLLLLPSALAAQANNLARERADFARWLATDPSSPYAAIAVQPIGTGLTLGHDTTDIPLEGVATVRLSYARGIVMLGTQPILPTRPATIGAYRLVIRGEATRPVLVVYGAIREPRPAAWYPHDPASVVTGRLIPPSRPESRRMLAPDGIEAEAVHAGAFAFTRAGAETRLQVWRFPERGEETTLLVFFRDSTSVTRETYPAGRFVELEPIGGERYRIDFNTAFNPWCAYRSVFPCPLPWPGNTIDRPITAGEKYVPSRAAPQ